MQMRLKTSAGVVYVYLFSPGPSTTQGDGNLFVCVCVCAQAINVFPSGKMIYSALNESSSLTIVVSNFSTNQRVFSTDKSIIESLLPFLSVQGHSIV